MDNCKLWMTNQVYNNWQSHKKRGVWSLIRKSLIRLWKDPACFLPVHGRLLYLPLSHSLPFNLSQLPLYDSVFKRLGFFLRQKYGFISVIDVGANVGDTIAAFFDEKSSRDSFLGIEPYRHFREYLVRNWDGEARVKILPYVCAAASQPAQNYRIVETHGTAEIFQSDTGVPLETRTLDEIVAEQPAFQKCNVVKVDTDGHDFEVIQGARKLLRANRPAVFFECAPLNHPNFIQECIATLEIFANAGYRSFIAYDNIGRLIGIYSLAELSVFQNLLYYQISARSFFIDVLAMKEEDVKMFARQEFEYHTALISDPNRRSSAKWVVDQL